MKLAQITSPKFQEAFGKLVSSEVPMKTAYKLKKILKVVICSLHRDFRWYEFTKYFLELWVDYLC